MSLEMTSQPGFIGIGAARSGTTWLGRELGSHPEIWIPRRKELHYFTRSVEYLSPSHLQDDSPLQRLSRISQDSNRFRREFVRAIGRDLLFLDYEQFKWDLRYFLGHYNDDWYKSLFAGRKEVVTGEITPAYALLNEHDIKSIAANLPNLKIIYIIRDPVERAWSTICYHESRKELNIDRMSNSEILAYLLAPNIEQRSCYSSVIERWKGVFGADQFMLAHYDEIRSGPLDLLTRLTDFLGVQRHTPDKQDLDKPVNQSSRRPMPEWLRTELATHYKKEIGDLAEKYGGSSILWYEKYFL